MAELEKPLLRRREVVKVTGLDRGRIQGWEQQGLWKWPGPTSSDKRFYSVADALRFAVAAEMEACGVPIRRAWEFIHGTPRLIVPKEGPHYLLYLELYRHGSGGKVSWMEGTRERIRDYVNSSLADLNDGHVRGIRFAVVNLGSVIFATLATVDFLGRKLSTLSEGSLRAEMELNDAEDEIQ
jgi:hypothetical protein